MRAGRYSFQLSGKDSKLSEDYGFYCPVRHGLGLAKAQAGLRKDHADARRRQAEDAARPSVSAEFGQQSKVVMAHSQ